MVESTSELSTALAGGAIGALLAALFAQAGRAWVAWGEVNVHDNDAAERNRQLLAWVDDRTRRLVQDMDRITNSVASQTGPYTGLHGSALAEAKAQALHEYRDEEWRAKLYLAELRAKEGAWHSLWRKVRGRKAPALTKKTLSDADPFLQRWREPVTRHGGHVTPLDRTTRTTDDALADLPSLKLT